MQQGGQGRGGAFERIFPATLKIQSTDDKAASYLGTLAGPRIRQYSSVSIGILFPFYHRNPCQSTTTQTPASPTASPPFCHSNATQRNRKRVDTPARLRPQPMANFPNVGSYSSAQR